MQKIISYTLVVVGCLAFASVAILLHFESDSFQLLLTELKLVPFDTAPIVVRVLVGASWALCLFTVLPTTIRLTALKFLSFLVLSIFALYVIVYSFFTPLHVFYFKNNALLLYSWVFLIVALISLLYSLVNFQIVVWTKFKKVYAIVVMLLLLFSGISASFLMNPVSGSLYKKPIPANLLLPLTQANITTPDMKFQKGRHIVCIMSYTCPHCIVAAKKFKVLQKLHPAIPIKVVLAGKEAKRKLFFNKTGMQQVSNYTLINDAIFWQLALNSIPAIYLVKNGLVEKRIHHSNISEKELITWLED
jgi:hypothetical protein